jgi:hypothetical protein
MSSHDPTRTPVAHLLELHGSDPFLFAEYTDLARFIAQCPACAIMVVTRLDFKNTLATRAASSCSGPPYTAESGAILRQARSTHELLQAARIYRTANRDKGWPHVRSNYDRSLEAVPDSLETCPAMRAGLDAPMTNGDLFSLRFSHLARVTHFFAAHNAAAKPAARAGV